MDLTTVVQLIIGGLTIGCVYSLIGLGYSLTLRATELINFAQAELVMLGAFIGLTILKTFRLPYLVVFVLASVLTGLFGLLTERVVVRPIMNKRSPLLNLLIATLGISIALQALAIVIWGREPLPYPQVFSSEPIFIFGLGVQPLNFWILGLGVAVMLGLQLFFQRTLAGISWRAAAFDANTAALYGLSLSRNRALTFALSAALGGAAGVLIAPLFFASFGLGQAVLVKAFAAAAIGGFGIVGTMVGGIVLGIIETLSAGLITADYKNVIMFSLLLVVLLFRFRPKMPAGRTVGEGPKVIIAPPLGLGQLTHIKTMRYVAVILVIAVWLLLPFLAGAYTVRVVNMALIFAIAVVGLQLIVGYTGQFSFGHVAFLGVGAYTSALLVMKLGFPFLISVPLSMVAAGLLALLVAPLLRLPGHYLAMGTMALNEIVFLLMLNLKPITNGAYGVYGIPFPSIGPLLIDTDVEQYFLISICLLTVYFFIRRLTNSRFGRGLVAVRENELAAVMSGVNANLHKIIAFIVGTACAGLAGALYAHYISYINPDNFRLITSIEMVTMVVIGGVGNMVGALIGAFTIILMPEYLRFLADYRLVVYGALLVVFMMFLPGGLSDLFRRPVTALLRVLLRGNEPHADAAIQSADVAVGEQGGQDGASPL